MANLCRRSPGGPGRRDRKLTIEHLESRFLLSADPVINEFLASNDGVIQDEDGDFSDLIEIYNQGDQSANLAGWYLTDDADELTKWEFPSVDLASGQYLVVFASEKDRAIAGSELHTNFRLAKEGEYLGLVQPNGTTIASQFSPAYPQQFEDVSYGIGAESLETSLLDLGTTAQVLIPADGTLGTTWTDESFVIDGSWQTGMLGVGYNVEQVQPPSEVVLQIDFNDRGAQTNTQSGFDAFIVNSGSENQTASVTRSFGDIDVTLFDATGGLGYEDRIRSTPLNVGEFSDALLLQDFILSKDASGAAGADSGLDVLIEGLEAGEIYTLTVWSFDTGSTTSVPRVSDWTANGITVEDYSFDGTATPVSNETYRFGMVVTADEQGEILLQGRRDEVNSDYGVFLNALGLETGDTLNLPGDTEVLRLDFNDRTDGESGPANSEAGYSVMTLDDNGSLFEGITVTVSAYNGSTLDDRDRSVPTDSGDFTLDQVYDDLIFSNGVAGTGMDILIEGLAPNAQYDLVLRSIDAGLVTSPWESTWTEESSGSSVVIASPYSFDTSIPPTSNDDNTMRASLITSPQGTLLLRGVQNGSTRSVVVNGLELTRSSFGELIGLDVESGMFEGNSSSYIRVPFTVADLSAVDQLRLEMRYDAGFVAYINGQEVARRNAPTSAGVPPPHDAAATAERSTSEALSPETFDLDAFIGLLNEGSNNVLAIHGLNSAGDDTDFLIAPRLVTRDVTGQALRYFETPTPGAANSAGVIDFVSAPQASVAHGFFESQFAVALTTSTAGADIYYTYDGSIPTPDNPTAMLYSGSITVDQTTVLRAAAVKDNYGDSPVTTETYIFLDEVLTQTIDTGNPANNPFGLAYPAIWQANATGDYEVDTRIDADPNWDLKDALLTIPTMSIVLDHDDLWNASTGIYPNATAEGDAWRRAGSIEYIDPNTGESFQHNVGVQMHGSASRDNVRLKKHSFRLIFSSEWDGPTTLEYPLFDNSDFADINTVVMRASFTDSFATRTISGRYSPLDSTYTRDVFMRDTQLAMGHPSPDSTYVHLYINGLYWGMYSPAERTDDAFLASRLGGERADWDIIRDFNELYRGSRVVYDQMFALANQVAAGSPTVANDIFQRLQGRNPDGTIDPGGTVYLDVDNFIDYMILHLHAGAEDWPSHNWVAARNRVDPGLGFKFFTWDQEIVYDGYFRDKTEANNNQTPGELFNDLQNSSEFRLRFADRVQKQMFNDGALTVEANTDRWQWRADQVAEAIIGESARWGDAREGEDVNIPPNTTIPLMTPTLWQNSIDQVIGYFPQSHTDALSRFAADGLWPSIDAPDFDQFGGVVLPGFDLHMSTTTGGSTIWYTTNGEDPRLLGGAVNTGSATAFSTDLEISQTTTVKARTLSGGQWSPLTEATFVVLQGSDGIVISEINYHPSNVTAAEAVALPGVEEDDFEFIEVLNTHPTQPISLLNMSLANGLSYTFGNVILDPGEYALVVENMDAFELRYGTGYNVLGEWSGGASNSGETIELRDALSGIVMAVSYTDENPWSEAPDGDGATLELVDTSGIPKEQLGKWYSWRASTEFGGSPGAAGVGPIGVVINEVLSHSNQPETDAIELYNTTVDPIDIGSWYLSDSGGSPLKFRIPDGTILAAGAFLAFDESDFNLPSPPPGQVAFALNGSEGDDVFLVMPDGSGGFSSLVDSVHFGPMFNGETFGRVPDGSGRLAPLSSNTLGAVNSAPRVGPLVISEVNYHPGPPSSAALVVDPSLTEQDLEFIEVYNRTSSTLSLTSSGLAGDAAFGFASGASLAPGETLVVVSFDPDAPGNATKVSAFRTHYGIDGSVALVGPFLGVLSDSFARIELQIPDEPPPQTPELIPLVLGDEVLYDDLPPWPAADGTGNSLNRIAPISYGNDGTSWQAATPSPGSVDFGGVPGDFDGDDLATLADLDLLVAAVQSASGDLTFDLDGDSDVTVSDLEYLVDVVVDPITGDYNWNSVVDEDDYATWRSRFGFNLYLNADGNRDGVVDAADYTVWRDHEGLGSGGGAAASAAAQPSVTAESTATVVAGPETSTEAIPADEATVLGPPAKTSRTTRIPPLTADAAIESLFDHTRPRVSGPNRARIWREVFREESRQDLLLVTLAYRQTDLSSADEWHGRHRSHAVGEAGSADEALYTSDLWEAVASSLSSGLRTIRSCGAPDLESGDHYS